MHNNKRYFVIASVSAFVLVVLYLTILAKIPVTVDSGQRIIMGTTARVVAVAYNRRTALKCIEAAFDQHVKVDKLMSTHKSDSEINAINNLAHGHPITTSPEVFEVLQKSLYFSKLTDGAFDVTVGPLVDLWHKAGKANTTPSDQDLAKAQSQVGWNKLVLDPNDNLVQFSVEGMKLDLGGIAKGYAIDKAVEAMQKCGAIGGLVDIGGDIRCFGQVPKGKDSWLVGLQDPNIAAEEIGPSKTMLILSLNEQSVATSGDYRRFELIQGTKHGHIMDTKTGQSSEKFTSVTVIAKDAITADALATALSVMDINEGLALIENLPVTEAIVIPTKDNTELLITSGVSQYIK